MSLQRKNNEKTNGIAIYLCIIANTFQLKIPNKKTLAIELQGKIYSCKGFYFSKSE